MVFPLALDMDWSDFGPPLRNRNEGRTKNIEQIRAKKHSANGTDKEILRLPFVVLVPRDEDSESDLRQGLHRLKRRSGMSQLFKYSISRLQRESRS